MTVSTPLQQIEEFVVRHIAKWPEVFLVEMKSSASNQITVLLDADNGITIEKCTSINKALYKFIEESRLYPEGNFSLEVSSPGVDRPLKLRRQYEKNVGRQVEVLMNDGTKVTGVLSGVDEESIVLNEEHGKGKKLIMNTTTILFNQIKHVTVLITF